MAGLETPDTQPRTVDAVTTTVEILEALSTVDEPTTTELSDYLSLSPSTVYSHLATLEQRGYVVKEGYEYRPSLRFLERGSIVRENQIDMYEPAKDVVKKLAQETGEVAWGMVEENGQGVFLLKEEGENAVESGSHPIGSFCPLNYPAPGKAILAFLEEQRVDAILEQHGLPAVTPNTVTDRQTLMDQLEEIRERGYARSNKEGAVKTQTVAAPVLDIDDNVLGAISVSGPASRINGTEFEEELPNILVEHANIIEINAMND